MQVKWCLSRGAKADAAAGERLVVTYALPHYALHYAALGGRPSLVRLLIQRHADVHAVDGQGNQALAWAAEAGHTPAVQALLKLGADSRHPNVLGVTALQLAQQAHAAAAARALGDTGDRPPLLYTYKPDYKGVLQVLQAVHAANQAHIS